MQSKYQPIERSLLKRHFKALIKRFKRAKKRKYKKNRKYPDLP
jgi:hypothetical protein